MATISPQDILFVTVLQRGVACMETTLTGLASYGDLMGAVRSMAPGVSGMATMSVRNTTGGWSDRRALYLK